MLTLNINNKEYKVKYGFNSFADTDLLERVEEISTLLSGANNDSDVSQMGKVKDLFVITRELLFVGLQNRVNANHIDNIADVGNLLDDYMDECPENEQRGLLNVFAMLSEELMNEGFLADLMAQTQKTIKSIPQDHKRSRKATQN